jgi:hypothetical protein
LEPLVEPKFLPQIVTAAPLVVEPSHPVFGALSRSEKNTFGTPDVEDTMWPLPRSLSLLPPPLLQVSKRKPILMKRRDTK